MPRKFALIGVLVVALQASIGSTTYLSNAEDAAATLVTKWYNTTSGLFDSTGWWESANSLTTLADLAAVDDSQINATTEIFQNTLVQAPNTYRGFLNDFYDDEGWWALGWIAAYDVTKDPQYLQTAEAIFDDMTTGWGTPCGGLWWNKKHSEVNAIANELFLSVAAHLANRATTNQSYYLNWALQEWDFFQNSGMINSNNNINDGLDQQTCKNNNGTIFTYNQGVILGGLVELNQAAPNASYIDTAKAIATAAITKLSDANGILHEPCEPTCDVQGAQFKGVFMRNLQVLQQAVHEHQFQTFITKNADSIWANDRNGTELSQDWAGPFIPPSSATPQSAALDALVAAVAVTGGS